MLEYSTEVQVKILLLVHGFFLSRWLNLNSFINCRKPLIDQMSKRVTSTNGDGNCNFRVNTPQYA